MKSEKKYEELASKIITYVGEKENILSVSHCVTRLRFVLKDDSIVKEEALKELPIIGTAKQGGQYQVIVGNEVKNVYDACEKLLPAMSPSEEPVKKKGWFNRILDTLSGILSVIIAPIIAGGMLKGILFLLTSCSLMSAESDIYSVLNIAGDCMFYFLPFLIAVSSAKKFKTNEYMALALAAAMMYPTIIDGASNGLEPIRFGFLTLPYINYKATIIPIILAVWLMKYVYAFFEKHIPSVISSIFAPLFTIVIMVPFELIFIAPLGYYGGNALAYAVDFLINLSPMLSGFIIAAMRPILVFTGMHHATRPIIYQQIATNGFTTVSPMNYCSTIAQATACLAIYFVIKDKKEKQLAMSSTISGYLGITEPGLYGIITKYRPALIGTIVGGGIGGMVVSIMGAKAYSSSMPSILTLPVYAGGGYPSIICGVLASVISTFFITLLLSGLINIKGSKTDEKAKLSEFSSEIIIGNPVPGKYVKLKDVNDKVFSEGLMGKGYAILPSEDANEITAPISGKIVTLMDTNHAFGIQSEDGLEVLIHVGIDTCKLEGKHFQSLVKKDDMVNKGEPILAVDFNSIQKEGYDTTTMVIITNSNDYNVEINSEQSTLSLNDQIIKVVNSGNV